jgi:sugar phosphate permease
MSGIGLVIGEILAMGVLFQFTKNLSYKDAFEVAAILILGISIIIAYSVKDPDMKKLRNKIDLKIKNSPDKKKEGQENVKFEELGLHKKIVKLTGIVK